MRHCNATALFTFYTKISYFGCKGGKCFILVKKKHLVSYETGVEPSDLRDLLQTGVFCVTGFGKQKRMTWHPWVLDLHTSWTHHWTEVQNCWSPLGGRSQTSPVYFVPKTDSCTYSASRNGGNALIHCLPMILIKIKGVRNIPKRHFYVLGCFPGSCPCKKRM